MDKRPNVIIIVPHDLGDYLGCYGHVVNSPNIDRLANEGVRFANHFCTAPFCSPARASIITGKYPHTHGLMGLAHMGWDFPKHNITDAQRFADAGYDTYLVGMQHETKSVEELGFDKFYPVSSYYTNYLADCTADIASQLLGKISRADEQKSKWERRPFYIRIGMHNVHTGPSPVSPEDVFEGYDWAHDRGIDESMVEILPQWMDTPGLRYDLAGFTGEVNNLDRGMGIILEAVKKYGFVEDTIVVFTTDHGISFPCAKATLYDLGIRTALIMRYPARFKGGLVIDELTSHIDILPTLLDECHIKQTQGIQGKSMIPLIDGNCHVLHEDIFAEDSTGAANYMRCIRTKQYKFIHNFFSGEKSNAPVCGRSRSVFNTGKFYFKNRPEFELYDIINDPHELNNLSGDDKYRDVESELGTRLESWLRETADPILWNSIKRPDNEEQFFRHKNEHNKTLWWKPESGKV